LDLTFTELAADAKLVLSNSAGTKQELDAAALALGNGYSAMLDGDTVSLELVNGAGNLFRGGGKPSRVVVSAIKVGLCEDGVVAESLCGVDDRVASYDVRQGRIGGCTGWLIGEDTFLQAGHCGTPLSSTRIHFTYGVSNAAPEDQYAVEYLSYFGRDGGIGNDFGVGRLLPNSVTGKKAGVAQSEKCGGTPCGWYTLGTVPSSTSGNNIRITGYGIADIDSRSQKTHVDALTTITNSYLKYIPDTTVRTILLNSSYEFS
jgi:hypothetical protein